MGGRAGGGSPAPPATRKLLAPKSPEPPRTLRAPLQVEAALEPRIRRRATEAVEVYEASYTKAATLSIDGGSGSGAQSAEPPPPCSLVAAGAPIRRDLASLPPLSLPPKTALPRGVPLAVAAAAATAPLSAGPVSLDATAIDAARQRGAQVRP